MNKLVATGKTVEDAVNQGLARLSASRDQVSVQILSQPSKGFLGWFSREAKVELTLQAEPARGDSLDPNKAYASTQDEAATAVEVPDASETEAPADRAPAAAVSLEAAKDNDPFEEAVSFLIETAKAMGLSITVHMEHGHDHTTLNISGDDLGMLIGRRGQTLDALQYLANIVANRYADRYLRIVLDAENFRARRQKTLEGLADRLAKQAVSTKKEVALEPMPASERKIIHARLQNHAAVKTYSKGDEPNRRVVISSRRS